MRYSECLQNYPELLYEVETLFQEHSRKNRQLSSGIRKPQEDGTREPKSTAQRVQPESQIGSQLPNKMESPSSEKLSPESQMLDNVDVQALGYANDSKLDVNQNVELVSEKTKLSKKSAAPRDTLKLKYRSEIILSPEKAEEVLVLLDAMSLRLIQCESKASRQLEGMITGAQEQINDSRKFLENFPQYMFSDGYVEYILEVGRLVEDIFATLESLTCKLVECHSKELCRTMADLQKDLKEMLGDLPPPKTRETKIATGEGAFGLELVAMVICFILFCFAVYLLAQPGITGVVNEFYFNDA